MRRAGVILTLVHPGYAASGICQYWARDIDQDVDVRVSADIKAASPC